MTTHEPPDTGSDLARDLLPLAVLVLRIQMAVGLLGMAAMGYFSFTAASHRAIAALSLVAFGGLVAFAARKLRAFRAGPASQANAPSQP